MEKTFYPYIEDDNFKDNHYDVNYSLQTKKNLNNLHSIAYNRKTYNQGKKENFDNKNDNNDKNDSYVWGVNSSDNIYRKKETDNNWQKINGGLSNVTASNENYVWGVNSKDDIYVCKKPCNNAEWNQINGSLKQVSGGEKEVWGINESNNIYKRNVDGSGSWKGMKGVLSNISASGKDYIWGVNDLIEEIKLRIKIVISTKAYSNFTISGKINNITLLGDNGTVSPLINVSNIDSTNNGTTLIVDMNISKDVKNISAIQFDINDTPFLITNVDIQIKDAFDNYQNIISSKNNKFINKKDNTYTFSTFDLSKEIPRIYRCKTDCNGDWEYIKGDMDMVSGGSQDVWGLKNGSIFKRSISKKDADWVQVPGSLKWISASSDNYVWGVDDGHIFKCKQPCNDGDWNIVPGSLKQISGGYERMEIKNNNTEDDLFTRIAKQKDEINKQYKQSIGGVTGGGDGGMEEEEGNNLTKDGYLLLARQTMNGIFFPKNTLDSSQFNQDKINELNYMNGKLLTDNFKFNGKYTFKLVWPQSNLKKQIWKQSSNPFKSNTVSGYEPIEVNYNNNFWGGLRNGVGDTVLSGSMNGDWFYAVGTFSIWNGGTSGIGIPGPNKAVPQVELYVKKNKYVAPKTNLALDLEIECGADYEKNTPCCGQSGTTVDPKYICPAEKPICTDYIFGSKWGKCVSSNDKNSLNLNMNQRNYNLTFYASGRSSQDGPNKIQIYAGNNSILTFTPPKDIWKKYEVAFINNSDNFDLRFMGLIKEGDHSSAITGIHLLMNNITVFNNNFSDPQLQFNSYEYITSNNKKIPGWTFEASLINNSSAWGYKIPYPDGNQAVSIQMQGYIIKNININNPNNINNNTNNSNKKMDALNKDMSHYKTLSNNLTIPTQNDVSVKALSKSVGVKKTSLGNFDINQSSIIDFYENFSNSGDSLNVRVGEQLNSDSEDEDDEINTLELGNLTLDKLQNKNKGLIQKYEIQVNQLKEISEKEKLYNKNSKMLQIVQARNSFKRKIISTLIASIFFFLIITIATFVYYKRTLK